MCMHVRVWARERADVQDYVLFCWFSLFSVFVCIFFLTSIVRGFLLGSVQCYTYRTSQVRIHSNRFLYFSFFWLYLYIRFASTLHVNVRDQFYKRCDGNVIGINPTCSWKHRDSSKGSSSSRSRASATKWQKDHSHTHQHQTHTHTYM